MPDTGRRFPWPWLAAFIALQLLYVWVLPPLHGPDEPSHLEYLHAVVDSGRLPLMAVVPYPVLFGHQGQGRTEARPITRPGPKTQQAQQPPVAYDFIDPLFPV